MPRRFTAAELDHAARLYASGQSFDQIAASFGRRSSEGIRIALHRHGVETRPAFGRVAHNRLPVPDDLRLRFDSGESVLAMAAAYGVARNVVTRWLREIGVAPRNGTEAGLIRMSRLTETERRDLTSAAHLAIRQGERSDKWQAAIAAGRERAQYGGRTSPGTERLCALLDAQDIAYIREKAVGRYNVDVALEAPRIAVEVLGGNWHGAKEIHARRTPYILDRGWHLFFVWDIQRCKVGPGALDHLIAYTQTARVHPASGCEYRVIRGDGKLLRSGRADDDQFPLVPPSVANLH